MKTNLQSKQIAEYFKENPKYKRLLKGIKNKYIQLGKIKGNVIINNPDKDEKQLLSGLMKKDYSKNKSISINLKVLQQRIDNSKFSGANLKEIIDEYFNEETVTKKEIEENYKTELAEFFEKILNQNIDTKIYKYFKEILENKNEVYYKLKKDYNKNKEELKTALNGACKGISNLPNEKTRIPLFASNVTGNPHGFDRNTLCGKIFIMFLCYIEKISMPRNTEELSEVYYNNNLLIDDVSNMVLCRNIVGFIEKDKCLGYTTIYERHKGIQGFLEYNEPFFLTLYNLAKISFIEENNQYKKVLITENPTVFMEIVDKCKIRDFPLICTYGQVKLAGIVLMNLLVESGYKLYYTGDLDPEGIQIADKLKLRYKDNLNLIGFDKETYYENLSDVELSDVRLQKLEHINLPELKDICLEIKKVKKAAYEERNIENIVKFIEKGKIILGENKYYENSNYFRYTWKFRGIKNNVKRYRKKKSR